MAYKNMLKLTYSNLIVIPDFLNRYKYLRVKQNVGEDTFGWNRYLNQSFYNSDAWKEFRQKIILRDKGHDLAMPDEAYEITDKIYIHHLNPITKEQLLNRSPELLDPENAVCISFRTHQAIHYGNEQMLLIANPIERQKGDTKLW